MTTPVKISYSPIKELIVHDVIEMNFEDLLMSRVTPSGSMPLFFCSGILFTFSSLPPTRDVIREYIEGKIRWVEVRYMKMEKYQPIVELHEEQYLKTRVINTSGNPVHESFVKWLATWEKANKK